MSHPTTRVLAFRFDDYYLDGANRQLWRGNQPVALSSKYLDVLLLLVSDCGRLVEKQRIFDEIWEGVFVTDAALTQCIKDIRRQIGDDAFNPIYIKTVPKHGYIFIGNAVAAEPGLQVTLAAAAVDSEIATGAPPSRPVQVRPYKFLDYYTEQDSRLFFGREEEIEVIRSQILSHLTLILHGRSGVGKSSLLRAGLLPVLKSQGHLVFVIRSFADPLREMRSALARSLDPDGEKPSDASLTQIAREMSDREPNRLIVFFLDQFEEFFLLAAEEARQRFVQAASALFGAGVATVRLVFALREDMLAEMSALKPAIREIFHHEYRLKRLSVEQAARAIAEPARAVGCEYEPRLVQRLIVDLGDESGVDPPQLQIVCDSLYDARDGDGRLTVELYERMGTAKQMLAGYLERVLLRFNAQDLRASKEILQSLISEQGGRLVVRESELETRLGVRLIVDSGRTTELVEEMVAARVVRRRNYQGEPWLELAHDFLTSEISRWLSEEEVALKRARAVIARAMENYRSHRLIVDADALELVLPFGERLGLIDEEADLLVASCLSRGRAVPQWLIKSAPAGATLIADALEQADSTVRICAVQAASYAPSEAMQGLLRRVALWDRDLAVRKAASISLAGRMGTRAQDLLSEGSTEESAGPIRRAVSLAMIRDHDKQLVRLGDLSAEVGILVVGGLMWVRLRRDGAQIIRKGVAGLLGGAASGLAGGFMLALGLAFARRAAPIEAIGLILVLSSLGFFIGALGGGGVSFGIVTAEHIAYRHSRWWSVVGGSLGGAFIGGSSNLLGVDVVKALFGQTPTGITGSLEGASIGAGLSLGIVAARAMFARLGGWSTVAGGSLGAMGAGVILALLGGNLFSASLEIVTRMFANSQIRMDLLASLFGQVSFGGKTHVVLGALEGLLFGAGVAFGISAPALSESSDVDGHRAAGIQA